MKTRFNTEALLIAVLGLISIQAKADVVYDNGPLSSVLVAPDLGEGNSASNSFTVSGPTSLASAEVRLWAYSAPTPLALDWSIGTTVFGSEVSSGHAALTNTYIGTYHNMSEYDSVFAIDGLLMSGTYYFTLANAVTTDPHAPSVYWSTSDGPSIAFFSNNGMAPYPIPSESFMLFSESASSVPDSSATITLLGGALAGLALMRRRLRHEFA